MDIIVNSQPIEQPCKKKSEMKTNFKSAFHLLVWATLTYLLEKHYHKSKIAIKDVLLSASVLFSAGFISRHLYKFMFGSQSIFTKVKQKKEAKEEAMKIKAESMRSTI